jgi:tetratricopeptide (TPR) repeat protein
MQGEMAPPRVLAMALDGLERALKQDPDDVAAGEACGHALALLNQWPASLARFEALVAKHPEQELSVVGAAGAAEELRITEKAIRYWKDAVGLNPVHAGYRKHLVTLLVKGREWQQALPHSEAWVQFDPMSAEARTALVSCLAETGNKQEARREFARLRALAPANLQELEFRFEKKLN